MIYITQLIFVKEGKESVFQEFESHVIPIMQAYSGRMVYRVRPSQEAFVDGDEEKPYEIHIVSFESEEKLQEFLKDDTRMRFKHLKDESVRAILMFKGKKF
ncbi:MAG: DUF1330 domain-containing protein [Reichenbachiella sp.]|uniref:DUF1330 domain-containing protein n=1 Tax=Reichenbachiella sp. TaxID=2184521 RepID=UPI003264A8A4